MSVHTIRLLPIALLGLCLAIPTLAWSATQHKAKPHTKAKQEPTLIWRGDGATATGIFNNVASAWERAGHGKIELQPFNTASGIDAVASGMADLGGSARANSNSIEDSGLTFTPVAWDGLVIITQAANPVSNLTLKQVRDIYYGRIHNWADVGGNPAPIDVYAVASPKDGVEYSLRSLLFGRGTQPVAAPRLYVNTRMLEKGIELAQNGLAVDTLADITGNPMLKAISIEGVAPTLANIADGSYPLFTPLYLVTNPRSTKAVDIQAFIDFLQSDSGKAALRQSHVLPYADGSALVALDHTRRQRIYADLGVPPMLDAPVDPLGTPRETLVPTAAPAALAMNAAADPTAGAPATAAATATPATPATPAAASVATYTVAKGDTLSTIARKYSVAVTQLREWNRLKNDTLQLGQSLRVRAN